jgi:hypothetical protein
VHHHFFGFVLPAAKTHHINGKIIPGKAVGWFSTIPLCDLSKLKTTIQKRDQNLTNKIKPIRNKVAEKEIDSKLSRSFTIF